MIIQSLIAMRTSLFRLSGMTPLDFVTHELRAEGLAVMPIEDYLSVSVNLPYVAINVILDGKGFYEHLFEIHIEESIGAPHIDVTDRHIGAVPDVFVPGVVLGVKRQLEVYSASLSALTKDPRHAAEIGLQAGARLEGKRVEGKRTRARKIIEAAGKEGIPASELARTLNMAMPKVRGVVYRLGPQYQFEQKGNVLMVKYVGRAKE